MSIGSKESDEVADEVGDGHNQLKELIEGQHLQNIERVNSIKKIAVGQVLNRRKK